MKAFVGEKLMFPLSFLSIVAFRPQLLLLDIIGKRPDDERTGNAPIHSFDKTNQLKSFKS